MSASACHRRVKQLEAGGVIRKYVAVVDRKKTGYEMEFFVEVSIDSQSSTALEAFEAATRRVPQILECHLMTGSADYLLKVAAADTTDYERLHREFIAKLPGVARIQSSLVLRSIDQRPAYSTTD